MLTPNPSDPPPRLPSLPKTLPCIPSCRQSNCLSNDIYHIPLPLSADVTRLDSLTLLLQFSSRLVPHNTAPHLHQPCQLIGSMNTRRSIYNTHPPRPLYATPFPLCMHTDTVSLERPPLPTPTLSPPYPTTTCPTVQRTILYHFYTPHSTRSHLSLHLNVGPRGATPPPRGRGTILTAPNDWPYTIYLGLVLSPKKTDAAKGVYGNKGGCQISP